MVREYMVVDVFTTERFAGNPAAVILDASGVDEAALPRLAAEFHLSETTFVYPLQVDQAQQPQQYRFRWFTPTVEMSICGHATIAAVHALVERGQVCTPQVAIHTRGGTLFVDVEGDPAGGSGLYWLQLVWPTLVAASIDYQAAADALALTRDDLLDNPAPVYTQDGDVILFARDTATVHRARPAADRIISFLAATDMGVVAGESPRGLMLTTVQTLAPTITAHSRFFLPGAGVLEDPVTGSSHGPLAVYLAQLGLAPSKGGDFGLVCTQGIPGGRGGAVYALVEHGGGVPRVKIGGHATTTMRGTVQI